MHSGFPIVVVVRLIKKSQLCGRQTIKVSGGKNLLLMEPLVFVCSALEASKNVHLHNEQLNNILWFIPYNVYHKNRFTTPLLLIITLKELPYYRRMCEWKSSHRSSKVHCTHRRWWVGVLRWQEN